MESAQQQSSPADRSMEGGKTIPADWLQGCSVVNDAGIEVGDIEEIVLDFDSGRISHVLVTYGSWRDSRVIAVPWHCLKPDLSGGRLVLTEDLPTLGFAMSPAKRRRQPSGLAGAGRPR